MVKFGQIWKWSYSKHVYQIPYAVCETAWEPSESPYGPDLDRVNYGPRNNSGEVDQLTFWQPKICAVETKNSADFSIQIFDRNFRLKFSTLIFDSKRPNLATKGWTWWNYFERMIMVRVTLKNETVLKWYSRLYDLDVSNFMATLEILKKS